MFKKVIFFILSFFGLFIFQSYLTNNSVFADTEFKTDVVVEYKVEENGITQVTHRITLENLQSNIYATKYSLLLDSIDVQNPNALDNKGKIELNTKKTGGVTELTVNFADSMVGKGKSREFSVSYTNPTFATRTGEVWEISIPRLSKESSFNSYEVILSIPNSFGNEAYISPSYKSVNVISDRKYYTFNKDDVSKTGITAGFGSFQVFSFSINYHLENPLNTRAQTEIALPPDTSLQKIYYSTLDPKPKDVYVDPDGNWLATYILSPRERLDVVAKGSVQIFADVRPFPKPTQESLRNNLLKQDYWPTDDANIIQIAKNLKTPRAIYEYVYQTLNYDYERVRPNVERLGATKALENPKTAICMEFTDLFVTLARAAGIPAREVNGYAYTENPQIQPLSMVADVLHSWPEYWDTQRNVWVPVDPTWASTTGGVDYFNKLDLRHFAFVMHGVSSTKPYAPGSYKLGSNPQKDVFVSFGQLTPTKNNNVSITASKTSFIPFLASELNIKIFNSSPSALYNLMPTIYFDKKVNETLSIQILPPFSTSELKTKIPFSFLGRNTPDIVTISVAGSELNVPTNKNQVIIYNLLIIFGFLAIIILIILFRLKKISISRSVQYIKNVWQNFITKFKKKSNNIGQF